MVKTPSFHCRLEDILAVPIHIPMFINNFIVVPFVEDIFNAYQCCKYSLTLSRAVD